MRAAAVDAVVNLGRMALEFGRVNRITCHEDGTTLESDTDHTVMLGLVACAFAERYLPALDRGKIAQYALVHDLPEVYAGDTPTLRALSGDAKKEKAQREADAMGRIMAEMAELPWVGLTLAHYEDRVDDEARYVKAMDKLLPKITHILNDCATPIADGMSFDDLAHRYAIQVDEIRAYAADFGPLWDLRFALIEMVMTKMPLAMETRST